MAAVPFDFAAVVPGRDDPFAEFLKQKETSIGVSSALDCLSLLLYSLTSFLRAIRARVFRISGGPSKLSSYVVLIIVFWRLLHHSGCVFARFNCDFGSATAEAVIGAAGLQLLHHFPVRLTSTSLRLLTSALMRKVVATCCLRDKHMSFMRFATGISQFRATPN